MPRSRRSILLLMLFAVILLVYIADFAVWRLRASRVSSVAVDQYLSTPLKGNKAEYDYLGTVQQACAVALFPHGGMQPCWWLRRHTSQWE